MADTLLLDNLTWDLTCDVNGDIAVASAPYAQAQDVASAARAFAGEVYYDTSFGMPYWAQILGHAPPLALLKTLYNRIALTVPGVSAATTFIAGVANRICSGQIQITTASGEVSASSF